MAFDARWVSAVALVVSGAAVAPSAQQPARGQPPPGPKAGAAFDITGYWVAVVSEDWRWRMVTPAKNDTASVPLNAEGRKLAAAWDLDQDNAAGNQCRAFGAGGVMRLPLRVHITWENDTTLKLETDAGQQTRRFRFGPPQAGGERSWQGSSAAEWVKQAQSAGLGFGGRGGAAAAGGALKVTTRNLRAGYLRKNGIPYSEEAVVTEYYNRHSGPGALDWFTVTTIVEDPAYLAQPFITSSSFRKEPDNAKWRPSPCETAPPAAPPLKAP